MLPSRHRRSIITIQYRELRNAVGLGAENPLDSQPIEELFENAGIWFCEMIREAAS